MTLLDEPIAESTAVPTLRDERGLIEVTGRLAQPVDRRLGYVGAGQIVFFRFALDCDGAIWNDGHSSGFGYGAWAAFDEVLPIATACGMALGPASDRREHVLVIDRVSRRCFITDRASAEELLKTRHA